MASVAGSSAAMGLGIKGQSSKSSSSSAAKEAAGGAELQVQKDEPTTVLQFKVELRRTKPPIWRRVQVPSTWTFFDLHKAIQVMMPWTGTHLHEFRFPAQIKIRKTDEGVAYASKMSAIITTKSVIMFTTRLPGHIYLDEKEELIVNHFEKAPGKSQVDYVYDLHENKGWNHRVVLETVLPALKDTKYPVCIGGRRRCPPEDPTEEEQLEFEDGVKLEPRFRPQDVDFNAMANVFTFDIDECTDD